MRQGTCHGAHLTSLLVLTALLAPVAVLPAHAAPEGQIVIAQGGDPSTLDPHMQRGPAEGSPG
ncbi:MAG: hypothetical protein HY726_05280 [Candidatus Rokubacteria bacterium]|nr:hypothetical protein [Candidatus Rokubacteria bacterium]